MKAYSSDMVRFERLKEFYEQVFFRADSNFKNVTGSTPTRQWVDETIHYCFLLAHFLEAGASGRHVVVISFNHDLCVEELMLTSQNTSQVPAYFKTLYLRTVLSTNPGPATLVRFVLHLGLRGSMKSLSFTP